MEQKDNLGKMIESLTIGIKGEFKPFFQLSFLENIVKER
jgi:hypothetical protein